MHGKPLSASQGLSTSPEKADGTWVKVGFDWCQRPGFRVSSPVGLSELQRLAVSSFFVEISWRTFSNLSCSRGGHVTMLYLVGHDQEWCAPLPDLASESPQVFSSMTLYLQW